MKNKMIFNMGVFLMSAFCFSACSLPFGNSSENFSDSSTQSSREPVKYEVTEKYGENGIDFEIDFNSDEDLRILQLADLQLQDLENARNENRYNQLKNAFFMKNITSHEIRAWSYVDEAVEKTQPHLIVLTGDNIYGETDDDGSDWLELCEKIDSFDIPWIATFGNHDNESAKGVRWQIQQLQNTEHCIFKRGEVTGNSNYNLLVKKNGQIEQLFFMLDTNGCKTKPNNLGEGLMPDNVDINEVCQTSGIYSDQIEWFTNSYNLAQQSYGKISVLMFYHIPPSVTKDAFYKGDFPEYQYFDDGTNFGICEGSLDGFDSESFYQAAKEINCKGMFFGHKHTIATSIMYQGIRLTYGLKTGTYDSHKDNMLGSTLITLKGSGDFGVEYIFSDIEYQRV